MFTGPPPVAAIAFQNKAVVYAIQFKAAVTAMTTLAANPRRLGADIGGVAVLHTWGQAPTHHPHVHCVVPGSGLSPDATDWVVYAKKPFGGPAQVLAYLGRYTHRVAIANRRIVAVDDIHVAFTWKDHRHAGATKLMRLEAFEFIRRFLLHTLPDGFHRIRHFGFMANSHRAHKLALCRSFLLDTPNIDQPETADPHTRASEPSDQPVVDTPACPCCGGTMRVIAILLRTFERSSPHTPPFRCDTS